MTPISPEILAAKLQTVRHGDYPRIAQQIASTPRLTEALWFIEWKSRQPGGLKALSDELLTGDRYPRGFPPLWEFGYPPDDRWTPEQCLTVWRALIAKKDLPSLFREFEAFANAYIDAKVTAEAVLEGAAYNRTAIEQGFANFNFVYFVNTCEAEAVEALPCHLRYLCEHVSQPLTAPWYFPDLFAALFDYMDSHAATVKEGLGSTEVSRLIFGRLGFGQRRKCPVLVLGDSRIGKTHPATIWCDMAPGKNRIVSVPPTDSFRDFMAAHADRLDIEYAHHTTERELKENVEYVLSHSGLYIIYDEAQFLLPRRFNKNTPPRRLDWVRCQVIDRGLGVAFFATRQSYHQSMKKFVRTTQYQMEQWIGRIAPPLELPSEIAPNEMTAAAKALFPALKERLLGIVVARCIKMETGFQHMEIIIQYAIDVAEQRGCAAPELRDVDEALAMLFPVRATTAEAAAAPARTLGPRHAKPTPAPAPRLQPDGEEAAGGNRISRLSAPNLVTVPARNGPEPVTA